MPSVLHCKYVLSTLAVAQLMWAAAHCCRRPALQEASAPHITSLRKDQKSEFKVRLLVNEYCFCTFVKLKSKPSHAKLETVWGFGVVCGVFKDQPVLSIQTNGWVVPLGIDEHLKYATKQKPTIYSTLSITNYALYFSFIIHCKSPKGSSEYKMVCFIKEMSA